MSSPRIAYLLKKFPRLSETFILNELLGLEDRGVELRVFSRRTPDDEPRHPELARLRAEIEELPQRPELDPWSELFTHAHDPQELLTAMGPLVSEVRAWNHPRTGKLIGEALWMRRRCAELGIDHLHVHFATDSAVVALLCKLLGGPTYSITAHAKDIYRETVDPAMLSRLVAGSEFTVTVCDANVRSMSEKLTGEARAKLRRLYNGIHLDAFAPGNAIRAEARILSVGRLVEKKGFDVLVDSLAELLSRGVAFEALLVGDGEEREAIQARIAERGLADRVRLLGALPQDEVRSLLATSTVFCLPCVVGEDGNRDALPTVLIESLAAGLPCISTPVTGVPEILGDGDAGVLVPERDPLATADALETLLADAEARRRIATAGWDRALELFDVRRTTTTLAEWLRECLPAEARSCAWPA
jgi:glycosyltransferase involved in cell wall biosynthesis